MSEATHISETVSAGQLRVFIERIERVDEEIRALNRDKSEIYKELRGCGFDVKAVRQCVAARKLDSAEREERNAIFDLYWAALTGFSRVHVHEGQSYAEEKGREVITPHDAETGEITESVGPVTHRSTSAAHVSDESAEQIQEQPETAMRRLDDLGSVQDGLKMSSDGQGAGTLKRPDGERLPISDVTAGETAPHSHSMRPSSLASDSAETVVPPPSTVSATPFDNPRCQHPDTCDFAHSKDACHDCLMAWAQRPKDEQIRLWAEANETARAAV